VAEPHDAPDAGGLLEAVREFLERDVMPATEGRVQFHARVAVNVLGMLEREWQLGPAQAAAHREGLARLGFADEAALAHAIRGGQISGDLLAAVTAFVRQTVRDKLLVANPRYLEGPRPPA
jgi:Domain of unknown function (DUF6285)